MSCVVSILKLQALANAKLRRSKLAGRFSKYQLWLQRTANQFGKDSGIHKQYRSTFGWVDKDGLAHGILLKFVDEYNLAHTDATIRTIDQITPLIAQTWHDSHWFAHLSPVTRRQRWGTVRSFFGFLHSLGVLERNPVIVVKAVPSSELFANVPLAAEQYARVLQEAEWYVDGRVKNGEREVYCRRMVAFLELLRHTGMGLIDAVSFCPDEQIRFEAMDKTIVPVLRYRRTKTKVEAIIPLRAEMAQTLKRVPCPPNSLPGMPFRYKGTEIRSDVHNWSRRISRLFDSKSERSPVQGGEGWSASNNRNGNAVMKKINPKMLRHTAAVGWLSAGLREEAVAKMLGHSSTEIVRRHYGPWCKQRDEAHIREVITELKITGNV